MLALNQSCSRSTTRYVDMSLLLSFRLVCAVRVKCVLGTNSYLSSPLNVEYESSLHACLDLAFVCNWLRTREICASQEQRTAGANHRMCQVSGHSAFPTFHLSPFTFHCSVRQLRPQVHFPAAQVFPILSTDVRADLRCREMMVANSSTNGDSPVANGNIGKRKSEDGSHPHTRAKRNRYISIAWYVLSSPMFKVHEANVITATSVKDARSDSRARRSEAQARTTADSPSRADQMQWQYSLPTMRQPISRVHICSKLLRWLSEGL
jgi:hypothetical protein